MKARELMIGDWVYDAILKGNTKIEMVSLTAIQGDFNTCLYNEETFDPIPLTKDILEANGFEEFDGWMLYEYEGNEISWMGTILKGSGELGNFEFPAIMYVHQFQHVLRICGIDKEIKIEI